MNTRGLADTAVGLELVAILAVAAEGAALIEARLAAHARNQALIDVVTGFGVIEELKAWLAGALGPKWPLDAASAAAPVVQGTVILVCRKRDDVEQISPNIPFTLLKQGNEL